MTQETLEGNVIPTLDNTGDSGGRGEDSLLVPSLEQEDIPRCPYLDGTSLRIVPNYTEAGRFCEANEVTITDGTRTVIYIPFVSTIPEKEPWRKIFRRHLRRTPGYIGEALASLYLGGAAFVIIFNTLTDIGANHTMWQILNVAFGWPLILLWHVMGWA